MKILIIGNGAREHALAWHTAQSARVQQVWVAPGNAGTAQENKCQNVDIAATDIVSLINFVRREKIDYTIVGPEAPLCAGIVDAFLAAKLPCLGPRQFAAQLEQSKAFSKAFMVKHGISTARYASFDDHTQALNYINTQPFPLVIKADGLAAGKGVFIAHNIKEAEQALASIMLEHQFGPAGNTVVIEEFLQGEEASFMVVTDGKTILPLVTTQDHKTRNDGDKGPNTGGMGAYSPAPVITPALHDQIMKTIITPTIKAMAAEGCEYTGFLYAGLMIDAHGQPKVLEFNCRLGDPEAEVILTRLSTELVDICRTVDQQKLHELSLRWHDEHALCVVLTAPGYPEHVEKDIPIANLNLINLPNVKVFHAGTYQIEGQYFSNGGRILCITAKGKTTQDAQKTAYQAIQIIQPNLFHFRRDIGYRAINLLVSKV